MGNIPKLEEAAVFCAIAAEHFRVFVSEIIGLNNAPFQDELDDALSNYTYQKLAIAMPRGFGKSTHSSIAYPLWEIAKNREIRILLVSSTGEIARGFVSDIIGHIERNPKYRLWSKMIDPKRRSVAPRLRHGKKREEHWTGSSFTVEREGLNLKDPTVNAVGLFGSIVSKRADIIILDDVVTQENAATEEQRAKIKDWVYTTLLPVLMTDGRLICLGNTWHMDDLMNNLLKDPQFQVRKRVPSILHEANRQDMWQEWANIHLDESLSPEEKTAKASEYRAEHKAEMEEGIDVLWPERFSYGDLYLKRIANPYAFARMYMCDPSIRPNQKFLEKDIEAALAKGKDLILQDAPYTEYDVEMTTAGLDLAIATENWNDDTVLLTLDRVLRGSTDGTFKVGDYVLRNIRRGKFSPKETCDMVIRNEAIVRPTATRVETNGFQEMMYRDLGDSGALVTSYKTGGEKNDPAIGVNSLAVLFEQRKIILPYSQSDARTRQLVAQLVNEMRAFPDGHTGDALMALWFAFSEMRDRLAGKIRIPEGSYTPPPPYPLNEKDADQELIVKQETTRGGYNPAQNLLIRAKEAKCTDPYSSDHFLDE